MKRASRERGKRESSTNLRSIGRTLEGRVRDSSTRSPLPLILVTGGSEAPIASSEALNPVGGSCAPVFSGDFWGPGCTCAFGFSFYLNCTLGQTFVVCVCVFPLSFSSFGNL